MSRTPAYLYFLIHQPASAMTRNFYLLLHCEKKSSIKTTLGIWEISVSPFQASEHRASMNLYSIAFPYFHGLNGNERLIVSAYGKEEKDLDKVEGFNKQFR